MSFLVHSTERMSRDMRRSASMLLSVMTSQKVRYGSIEYTPFWGRFRGRGHKHWLIVNQKERSYFRGVKQKKF